MVKKILNLDTKDIFFYVFSSYFLFGMHVSIEHVGGYGLYLPFNIIGWIFISFLIGLGLYQISKSRKRKDSDFGQWAYQKDEKHKQGPAQTHPRSHSQRVFLWLKERWV